MAVAEMDASWRSTIGMSDRMAATMKIMSACKSAFPESTSLEVQDKAKRAENNAFEGARSKEQYHDLWTEQVEIYRSSAKPELQKASRDSATPDVPVQRIGRYDAKHHASGITAEVFRTDLPDGTTVAIKLTTPHLLQQPHNSRREARLLGLASHQNVVPLLSTENVAGGHFLLIFPFLPYAFDELLHNDEISRQEVISHLHSLFVALEHIHSMGIIHRDIKPSNLLLQSPSGPAYLSDFGISWHNDDPDSEQADDKITDVGTTCYRPPELLFGNKSYGQSLDMWAAGCVVAEALERKSLFDAGELGSDLALIRSIFTTLGTPNDATWPEAKRFRDWGKIQFAEYPRRAWEEVLPNAGDAGRTLVNDLVQFQSTTRLSATEAACHPLFSVAGKGS